MASWRCMKMISETMAPTKIFARPMGMVSRSSNVPFFFPIENITALVIIAVPIVYTTRPGK